MNPITHLLASWALGESAGLSSRDRNLVTWAGVAPDLDGLGAIVDAANRALGRPESTYYWLFHHSLLHGLFAALLLPALFCIWANKRLRMFLFGVLAVHLHLLCDLAGSRGPDAGDVWPVPYLMPFSERLTLAWPGQWELNAWPNILFTVLLIIFVFHRAAVASHSPVSLFSDRADQLFVKTVQARWYKGKNADKQCDEV